VTRPVVAFNFPAHSRCGYSTASYGLCQALEGVAKDVRLVPHPNQALDARRFPADRRRYLEALMHDSGLPADLIIVASPPTPAAVMGGPRTVVWTTQECDRINPKVAEKMDDPGVFQRIWAHSQFAADAFVRSGVRRERVDVVRPCLFFPSLYRSAVPPQVTTWPDGYEHKTGGPAATAQAIRARDPRTRGTFRFGYCGTWHERKGYRDLLRAYAGTFAGDDDVVMEIKTSPMNMNESSSGHVRSAVVQAIEDARKGLKVPAAGWPSIRLEVGTDWSDIEMMEWVASLDCYANASYGEGTGITQTWAMGMGIPIVTTMFGGVGETLQLSVGSGNDKRARAYVVPHRMAQATPEMRRYDAIWDAYVEWAEYDVEAFGGAMRQAFMDGPRNLEGDPDEAQRVRLLYGEESVRAELLQAIEKTTA